MVLNDVGITLYRIIVYILFTYSAAFNVYLV